MDDDFNTSGALSHLFDLVRAINQARADGATDAESAASTRRAARADRRAGSALGESQIRDPGGGPIHRPV